MSTDLLYDTGIFWLTQVRKGGEIIGREGQGGRGKGVGNKIIRIKELENFIVCTFNIYFIKSA